MPPEQAESRDAKKELFREHLFHDALRNRKIHVELGDIVWRGPIADRRGDRTHAMGLFASIVSNILLHHKEVGHIVLVGNKEAFIPMVTVARREGLSVTLIASENGSENLQKACDTYHYVSREEMEAMAYVKTSGAAVV